MSKSRVRSLQLDLFRPAPTRPHWRSLPADVRSRVLELLVQLIQVPSLHRDRDRGRHGSVADRGREVGDE